jgi:hypothetical protein
VMKMGHALGARTKTALILASIAAAFFAGIVLRHWWW